MKRCRQCNHFVSPLHRGPCPHCKPDRPVALDPDEKRKGWATPYGFADFAHPVTYAEACAHMKEAAAVLFNSLPKASK